MATVGVKGLKWPISVNSRFCTIHFCIDI